MDFFLFNTYYQIDGSLNNLKLVNRYALRDRGRHRYGPQQQAHGPLYQQVSHNNVVFTFGR